MNELQRLLANIEDPWLREEITRSLERKNRVHRQLYIPEIGDGLKLVRPWAFMLYSEYRNRALWEALDLKKEFETKYRKGEGSVPVELPIDTVLTVDRIYVRKDAGEYSSITFRAFIPEIEKRPRFWAKLQDVNQIVFEPVN